MELLLRTNSNFDMMPKPHGATMFDRKYYFTHFYRQLGKNSYRKNTYFFLCHLRKKITLWSENVKERGEKNYVFLLVNN
jgi:hypothetical protein